MDAALKLFCNWLAATPLSLAIQTHGWVIPALQTIHILGVAIVFSSAVLVNFRLWRIVDRREPLDAFARRFLPTIWPTLLVLLGTGALLIIAEPKRSLQNTTFYLKMAMLFAAIGITAGLQWTLTVHPDHFESSRIRRALSLGAALLSTLVWSGVLIAGRWIAYTRVG